VRGRQPASFLARRFDTGGQAVYITGTSGNACATVAYKPPLELPGRSGATHAQAFRWRSARSQARCSSPGGTDRAASFRDYTTIAYHG